MKGYFPYSIMTSHVHNIRANWLKPVVKNKGCWTWCPDCGGFWLVGSQNAEFELVSGRQCRKCKDNRIFRRVTRLLREGTWACLNCGVKLHKATLCPLCSTIIRFPFLGVKYRDYLAEQYTKNCVKNGDLEPLVRALTRLIKGV